MGQSDGSRSERARQRAARRAAMTPAERKRAERRAKIILGSIVGFILLTCCCCCCGPLGSIPENLNAKDKTITVCELTDQATGNKNGGKSHQYMVFAKNGGKTETYVMEDGFLFSPPSWRTNTSDVWGGLEEDAVYDVKTTGWRIGIGSTYPNLYIIKKRTDLQPEACPKR